MREVGTDGPRRRQLEPGAIQIHGIGHGPERDVVAAPVKARTGQEIAPGISGCADPIGTEGAKNISWRDPGSVDHRQVGLGRRQRGVARMSLRVTLVSHLPHAWLTLKATNGFGATCPAWESIGPRPASTTRFDRLEVGCDG